MALGVCPMCAAVFSADAPFKQHFLDVHGLDDDPGTETRLPDDPEPEPEPESDAEAPKKRRVWGGGRGAASFEPSKVPDVVAVAEEQPAAVEAESPPADEIAEDPVVDIEVVPEPEAAAEADGLEYEDLVIVPEPVIVSLPEPDDDEETTQTALPLRLVTVAGVAFVLVVFVLAAVRLTDGDASPSAADESSPAAVVTVPPPAVPAAPPSAGEQYVVARGDSLSKIANRLGVSVEALVAANGIADRNLIFPGQVLTVPR